MAAYYNEFNPQSAHMLRQLIADGCIAAGDVDERSIVDVQASDLTRYKQCHFFAGIGGWSVALRIAGWPDDRPVWTGSCPCQPFSAAGKGGKQSDERHLWPHWYRLIRESSPSIIFGEQVASAITAGWWDDVATDLEAENYTSAAAVLPACSVGTPHRRDRLWFVANSTGAKKQSSSTQRFHAEPSPESNGSSCSDVADPTRFLPQGCKNGSWQREFRGNSKSHGDVVNTISERGRGGYGQRQNAENANPSSQGSEFEWIACPDGKSRPVKRGVRLLAYGVQHRAPILHAFGNAIVPEVAAKFIEAAEGAVA